MRIGLRLLGLKVGDARACGINGGGRGFMRGTLIQRGSCYKPTNS